MKKRIYAFLLALYVFLTASILHQKYSNNNYDESELNEVISINKDLKGIVKNITNINFDIKNIINIDEFISKSDITPNIEVLPTAIITPTPTIAPTPTPVAILKPTEKTIDEIALEVIGNKWGYGQDKINALTEAGYDYNLIEQRAQEIRRTNRYTVPDRNTYIHNFAYTPYTIYVYDENKNIVGSLSQYQKILLLNKKIDNMELVSYGDQTFYVNDHDIRLLADSHIEVDISDQKVYLYIDGKKILDADVITGFPGKGTINGTNQGITKILLKEYDVILNGENHVDYFLSFNWDSEGFHDADWREAWEFDKKDRYLTHGSNGCVNMKLDDVKVLEENSYISMPVLIHK